MPSADLRSTLRISTMMLVVFGLSRNYRKRSQPMDAPTHPHRHLIAVLAALCLLPAACNTGDSGGADGTVTEQGDTWRADAMGDAVDEDAAGEEDVSSELEPVECGEMTCGSDQYCVVTEGCGADVGFNDAGEWRGCGSPFYTCRSIPDSCDPTSLCDCEEVPRCAGGTCEDSRNVTCYAR